MTNPDLHVTLASTLLDLERDREIHQVRFTPEVGRLYKFLPGDLWVGGSIAGVGHLWRDGRNEGVFDTKHDHSGDKDLLRALITTHLLHLGQRSTSFFHSNWHIDEEDRRNPSVFLVTPPNSSSTSSIYRTIHDAVQRSQLSSSAHTPVTEPPRPTITNNVPFVRRPQQNRSPPPSPEEITLTILDSVRLIQYLDLTGLAESLSEASHLIRSTSSSSASDTERNDRPGDVQKKPKILVIEGISQALARATARSPSGLAQIAALLTNILRSIRQLVRECPDLLVLVDIDLYLDPPEKKSMKQGEMDEGMCSAFADPKGRVLRIEVGNSSTGFRDAGVSSGGGGGRKVANSVLGRILENALDVVVVVHGAREETQGRCIVEVVKDTNRNGMGSWAVWRDE